MNWAELFERASDHETATETIRTTLAAVRTERDAGTTNGSESDG